MNETVIQLIKDAKTELIACGVSENSTIITNINSFLKQNEVEIPKPCEHLRNTNGKFWCNGIEIYWQDCCKSFNKYKVDDVCHDNKAVHRQLYNKCAEQYKRRMNGYVRFARRTKGEI